MFRLDSRVAAGILEITPETYRQRLSRVRRRMADFLREYCGLSGTGMCACRRRVDYAAATHRLDPRHLEYQALRECEYSAVSSFTDAMEELDAQSQVFAALPAYRAPERAAAWVRQLLASRSFSEVLHG